MTDIQTQYETLIKQALLEIENVAICTEYPYPPEKAYQYNKWWVQSVIIRNYDAIDSLYWSLPERKAL